MGAFELGASEDCPSFDEPQRESCVPGYVARAEGAPPMWRCPVTSLALRFDDPKMAWWGWERIERMHIDANAIVGGIPDDLPTRWPHLRSLDLHDNAMSGSLPDSLLSLPNLTQLQVQ